MTHELGPLPARWYSVSNDGLATRCHDEEDARYNATQNDLAWPRGAPHRAVQLVDVAEVARAVAAERERCARICDTTPPYPFRPSIEAAHAIRAAIRGSAQAHGQTPGSQG